MLKVVTIPRESWHDLEEVVLEQMTVFPVRSRPERCQTVTVTRVFTNTEMVWEERTHY